ncbi:MAG: nucleotidyltransferase family protein [Betaproteobacteria bacterium]|nr:MAG: nucleotidyltransferase family protein [Betaproteobacteria bacterium]
MKAIVLAAGRGDRMRPLTDRIPKPLLRAGGRTLIEWQILRLVRAGVRDIVVNVSHLGEKIVAALADGTHLGARIEYSREPVALETAGGIALAMCSLGTGPFLAVNADIYCDFDYRRLAQTIETMQSADAPALAHLVLVGNPDHHPKGDFVLGADGRLRAGACRRLTFSGIGVYRQEFFAGIAPGERKAVGPMLHAAIERGCVFGERYDGVWMDIGTPERLNRLRVMLSDGADHSRRA